MKPLDLVRLTPGKRVLFLTKDPELIRRQLAGELDLRMEDLAVEDLLDDINTDAMTPAWVCFSHRPEDIARDAYAGLIVDGKRLFEKDALIDGNFEVIVAGAQKGVGSSREQAAQCEGFAGRRLAVACLTSIESRPIPYLAMTFNRGRAASITLAVMMSSPFRKPSNPSPDFTRSSTCCSLSGPRARTTSKPLAASRS